MLTALASRFFYCSVNKHSIITDNAIGSPGAAWNGGYGLLLIQTEPTCTGDVANKIGTYLKALAARDNNIPFYPKKP